MNLPGRFNKSIYEKFYSHQLEFRESFEMHCLEDGPYPDKEVPELRLAAQELAPKLCQLTMALLKCMALGLGRRESHLI